MLKTKVTGATADYEVDFLKNFSIEGNLVFEYDNGLAMVGPKGSFVKLDDGYLEDIKNKHGKEAIVPILHPDGLQTVYLILATATAKGLEVRSTKGGLTIFDPFYQ